MRKQEKETIRGYKVTVTQHKPRAAFRLGAKLVKYIAPVIQGMKPTDEIDFKKMAPALFAMMRDMDDADLDVMLTNVLSCTTVVGDAPSVGADDDDEPGSGKKKKWELSDPKNIDEAFAGNVPAMLEVAQFALKVNFADFFADGSPSRKSTTAETPEQAPSV